MSVGSLLAAAARIVAGVLLLLAALPTLLSSAPVVRTATALASRVLPGRVSVRRVRLAWTSPVLVEGLAVHEAGTGRQLVGLERFSSAEPLSAVLTGKAGLTLTLTDPSLDLSLDDAGEVPRLARFFQGARLANLLSSRPAAPAAAAAQQQRQQQQQQQQQQQPAPAAATSEPAAPSSSVQRTAGAAGSHPALDTPEAASSEPHQGTPAVAAPAARSAGPITASAVAEPSEPEPAAAAAATGASAPGDMSGVMAPLRRALTRADAVSHVSAELRLPRLSLYVPDGRLLVPAELKAAVGAHIHAVAAVGQQQVLELAEELGEEAGWLSEQRSAPPQQQQQQQQQADGLAAAADWPIPPVGVSSHAWGRALPVMTQVSGDRMSALLRGWVLGRSHFLLQQPAQAAWEFTPELAKLTLSQFNPLLQEVAFIREGGQLLTSYAPAGGSLTAPRGQVHVSPVRLVVGHGQLLADICSLLGISQPASVPRRQRPADKQAAAAGQADAIEVWSGPLHVAVEGPGLYRTSRVDMLLGSGKGALHVAVWGLVDVQHNRIDMKLGLPASTLARAGIRHLAPGYVLPLALTGPLKRPALEWHAAVRKLAVLSAMQLGRDAWGAEARAAEAAAAGEARRAGSGLAGLLPGLFGAGLSRAVGSAIGQVDQRLSAELLEVPPPAELPWETSSSGSGPVRRA